jgi:hypothetical protein
MSEPSEVPSEGKRRRVPRWLIAVAVVLVVLIVAVFVVVPMLVDPENYRDRIELALEDATGWQVELETIDLALGIGGAALTVSPARMTAPGGDTSSFQIDTLAVHASLLPLLSGALEIDSVELRAPSITLVRPSAERGWVVPEMGAGGAQGTGPSAPAGIAVTVEHVGISEGNVTLVDRTFSPARELSLSEVDVAGSLATGRLDGTARLADAPVTLEGRVPDDLRIGVEDLPTEALSIAPGGDLVLSGGTLSGDVRVRWPDGIEADLTARDLAMLAGSDPLEQAQARFRVVPGEASAAGWRMEDLEVVTGEAKLVGSGPLTPELALDMRVDEAPVEDAVRAVRALAPVPVEVRGPGSASARVTVRAPAGGAVDISVDGRADAGELRVGGPMPPARDVAARFGITGTDRLTIDIEQGTVGGGPLSGQIRVEPLAPPGKLSFDGKVQEATFGELLVGFAGDRVERVGGKTDLTGDVGLDLSSETIDPTALTGTLSVNALDVAMPGWDLEGALRGKLEQKLEGLGALSALLGGGDETGRADEQAPEGKTLLDEIVGSVRLQGDVWKLDPVRLIAGGVTARGSGEFVPGKGEVDLVLEGKLDREATKKLVSREKALRYLVDDEGRLSFPLKVTGPMMSPKFGIDLGELAPADAVKDKLKDKVKDLFD